MMSGPQNTPGASGSTSSGRRGRGWSVAGIVCGVVAIVFIPVLFGPLGILFGFLGRRAGDRGLGTIAMIVSVVGLVVGLVIGALLLTLVGFPAQPR